MTGLAGTRVYLDWNASAPLRPEARAAMLAAMYTVGNPSSVHAEGRAAKAIVEKARGQVAALVGCEPSEVVFTSGATEAANTVLKAGWETIFLLATEHDAIWHAAQEAGSPVVELPVARNGQIDMAAFRTAIEHCPGARRLACIQVANSETGIVQPRQIQQIASEAGVHLLRDATQAVQRPMDRFNQWFEFHGEHSGDYAVLSAHKMGGPKGIGALIIRGGNMIRPLLIGGGQEQRRRAGTENVAAIAGFGALQSTMEPDTSEWAQEREDAFDAAWAEERDRIAALRASLEERLISAAPDAIIFGDTARRLINTSCFAVPHWRGETQVMQMDLAGFAVSAGSACSSGKVNKASRVLLAMGFDEVTASSAIRVSMGPTTTEAEVMAFADAWIDHYRRRKSRAA